MNPDGRRILFASLPSGRHERRGQLALGWLMLATAAVAASSLFAILIVLARVPGLGSLFPGTEFYRVALTLHVNLSQWVWFMAFAGLLWCMAAHRAAGVVDWSALVLATAGALMMTVSPAIGVVRPIMSNYLPVLDSPVFLAGLAVYGLGVLASAACALIEWRASWADRTGPEDSAPGSVMRLGLWLAAAVVVAALLLFAATWGRVGQTLSGFPLFETLFWGPGHVWQFCLTTLMLVAWLGLTPARAAPSSPALLKVLLLLGVAPVLATVPLLPADPASAGYFAAFTRVMQWASWEIPVLFALVLLASHWRERTRPDPGIGLSLLLLVCGILLGTVIAGQTTLVTAHYHGTIGAVTLAFMALTYGVLPAIGHASPPRERCGLQLRLYGYGILMMMSGLAGAGLMGAPRKMAGDVGIGFGIESFSRMLLGIGGTLATIGILMFLHLVLRQLWPGALLRVARHG